MRSLFFRPGPKGEAVYAPSRYKIAYGGRGSGKSWGFGSMAVALASQPRPGTEADQLRVLCVRETQKSIDDSIKQLIADRIGSMGVSRYFDIQASVIRSAWGGKIGFAGIKTDPAKIKSWEGCDICLVEEAEKVSKESWRALTPTIRKPGCEVWVSFNPREETDETFRRFVLRLPPDARRVKMNWEHNPWFTEASNIERLSDLARVREAEQTGDEDERIQLLADYEHIWEGEVRQRSDATIFRKRVVIETFPDNPPHGVRLFFGADWGFATDPTTLIRFWVTDHKDATGQDYQELWISHEAFSWHCELDEIPALFSTVPDSKNWPIKADCARPETISHVARLGYNIGPAEKWQGSVEDGIAHVKAFRRIHIHTRCRHLQQEARLYSYKVDRVSGDVLPLVVDAHNHGWDAIRYGLDGYIQRRGINALWARLAE